MSTTGVTATAGLDAYGQHDSFTSPYTSPDGDGDNDTECDEPTPEPDQNSDIHKDNSLPQPSGTGRPAEQYLPGIAEGGTRAHDGGDGHDSDAYRAGFVTPQGAPSRAGLAGSSVLDGTTLKYIATGMEEITPHISALLVAFL